MTTRIILLTGVTGYLGSHLALGFLERGHRLKALIRPKEPGLELRLKQVFDAIRPTPLMSYLLSGQLEVIQGDVTDRHLGLSARKGLALAAELTDVVHCAATISFDPAKAAEVRQVNIEGVKNILEFLEVAHPATFHYVSTAFVAGRKKGAVQEGALDGATGFNNAYEESKFLAELEVRKAVASGLPTVIYRPSILIGDSQTGQTQSLIGFYTLLRSLALVALRAKRTLTRRPDHPSTRGVLAENGWVLVPLRVEGSESKTLNIVPIDYVIRLILAIFQDSQSDGKTFHIVSTAPPTIGQLRDWMCEALGMRGVSLVESSDFERKPMNYWERLFANSTKEYGAYLGGEEPVFLAENTLRIARREEIVQPAIDSEFVRLLTRYCQESQWGKRRVKPAVHLLPPLSR